MGTTNFGIFSAKGKASRKCTLDFWLFTCILFVFVGLYQCTALKHPSSKLTVKESLDGKEIQTRAQTWHEGKSDSVNAFLQDLNNLDNLTDHYPLLTMTHSKRDSSYTKSWKMSDWEYHQAYSLKRYARHLWHWPQSPTARAVLPTVLVLVIWSAVVFYVAHYNDSSSDALKKIQTASFSTGVGAFTAPLSLLLALRTNRALDRLLEARREWGRMIWNCKSLAGLFAAYLMPIDKDLALLLGRYLSLYGWTVKGYFRNEDDKDVIATILPPDEIEWLRRSPSDLPTAIVSRIRHAIALYINEIPQTASQAMEARLLELESVLGICKRIVGSPIPPTYTRHTSRVLCLYLGLVPVVLVGNPNAKLINILLTVAFISYVFVGIDEIGVEVENPGPLLPMYHLCKVLQKNVLEEYVMSNNPN